MTTAALAPQVTAKLRADDARIIITGAGGWLGMATLELLHHALGNAAFDRRVVAFGSRARDLLLHNGNVVKQQPLAAIHQLPARPSLLLHFAFLTKDKAETMDAPAYVSANRALSQTVLTALDPIGVTGVFIASSGAARFADDPHAAPALRLYGTLKRADEAMFAQWATTRGTSAVIARIFNVAGPYISHDKAYALADFIVAARAGAPVRVHAPCRVERGYVAIRELMSLVFALLLDAPGVTAFDTGGDPIELRVLAECVATELGSIVERAPITADQPQIYLGDRARYDALRTYHAIDTVSLADQVRETITGWPRAHD